jgi:predicted Zn-dependent peptidase
MHRPLAAAFAFCLVFVAAAAEASNVQRVLSPKGIEAWLVEEDKVPLIAISFAFVGGASQDPADKPGVAALVAGLLDRGAGKRNAYEFADAVEGVGGTFNAGAGAEAVSVNGQFLARDRALMIELLADALMRPHFDAAEFRAIAIATSSSSSRRRIPILPSCSASMDARRCLPGTRTAVRKAAASARWPRSPRVTW